MQPRKRLVARLDLGQERSQNGFALLRQRFVSIGHKDDLTGEPTPAAWRYWPRSAAPVGGPVFLG